MRRKLLLLHCSRPTNPEHQNDDDDGDNDDDDDDDDDEDDDDEEEDEDDEGEKSECYLATPQPSALPARIAAVARVCLCKHQHHDQVDGDHDQVDGDHGMMIA